MAQEVVDTLVVRMRGETAHYEKAMQRVRGDTRKADGSIRAVTNSVNVAGMRFRGFGSDAAAAMLPLLGISGGIAGAFKGISLAAEAEKNEIAFGTMLRSAEAGKKMVADLQKFAAETPLNTGDIQGVTKELLQVGFAAEEIIPNLRMLGDVVGGDAQMLRQVAHVFGQVRSQGRLMGNDVFQFINAGWNPLNEIAESTGKTMVQLKQEMEKGGITYDMVAEAMRRATSAGGKFHGLMAKQSQSLSGLFSTMKDDIDSAMRDIGKSLIENLNLKGFMKDVSALAQAFTNWFSGLSAGTKSTIVSVTLAAAAFGILTTAIVAAGMTFNAMFGGIGVITGVIITALTAIGALVGGLAIEKMGGLAGAWEVVKTKALEFWEWLKPIRQAAVSLGEAIIEYVGYAWDWIQGKAKEAWEWIVAKAGVSTDQIRDFIRDAFIFAEFTIRNFGQVWETVWAGAKYYLLLALEEYKHWNQVVVPALHKYFEQNWKTMLGNAFHVFENFNANLYVLFSNTIKYIFTLFSDNWDSMKKVIKGMMEGDFTQVFKVDFSAQAPDLKKGMVDMMRGVESLPAFPTLPPRVRSELEKQWQAEFDALKDKMGQDFAAFRAKKLEEWAKDAGSFTQAEEVGKMIGGAMAKGMAGKTVEGKDAVSVRSAEALSRLTAYRENVKPENYLKEIRDLLKEINKKDGVVVKAPGLEA